MAAVDLPAPAIAHPNLAVAPRCTVADDKLISEPVPHAPHMSMIVIENGRVALPGAAVVNDDELPAVPLHWRAADFLDDRSRQIAISRSRTGPRPRPKTKPAWRRRGRRLKTLIFLETRFLDGDLRRLLTRNWKSMSDGRLRRDARGG